MKTLNEENINKKDLKDIKEAIGNSKTKIVFKILKLDRKENFVFSHSTENRKDHYCLSQFSKKENNEYTVDLIYIEFKEDKLKIETEDFIASDENEILSLLNLYFKKFKDQALVEKLNNPKKSNFIGLCE